MLGVEIHKEVPSRVDHLLGRQCSAGTTPHAIGHYHQDATLGAFAGKDASAILLFTTIANMLSNAGSETISRYVFAAGQRGFNRFVQSYLS